MATRKRGMKAIPPLYSQAKDVFPVTAFRALNTVTVFTAGGAGGEREVVDLDLQFEDNEVLDIIGMHCMTLWDFTNDVTTNQDVDGAIALFEDPDKLATIDLFTEALWEDDNSLIHMETFGIFNDFVVTTNAGQMSVTGEARWFLFPQPYTVARNVALISGGQGTEGDPTVLDIRTTLWGRRRNASDAEFKNIIYRQRF